MRVREWVVAGLAMAISAGAAAQPRSFAIPAQPVAGALLAYTQATGLTIAADAALTRGRASPGVQGEMEPGAALDRLLVGSGLIGRVQGGTVVLAQAPPEVRLGAGVVELPQVEVEAGRGTPPTGTIGQPQPAFAGGQVATGGRLGMLGNRSIMDTPFSQNNYTEQLVRDQQARTLTDVVSNDPSVRINSARLSYQDQFFIRGFPALLGDITFDGLYGLVDGRRPAIEAAERIEILRGPSALLGGLPRSGTIGGTINLVPKRATDEPLTRLTLRSMSTGNVGGAMDLGRRFGANNEFGIRLNGALDDGRTPINGQSEGRGLAAAGLDYRGERLRLSADLGYQAQDNQRPAGGININPGIAIPRAPRLDRSLQQPWEYFRSNFTYGMLRGEYDIAPNLTAFAAYGHSHFYEEGLTGSVNILNSRGDFSQQVTLFRNQVDIDTGEAGVRARFSTGPVSHAVSLTGSGLWSSQAYMLPFTLPAGAPIPSNLYSPVFVAQRPYANLRTPLLRVGTAALTSYALGDTLSILDERVQLTVGLRYQQVKTDSFNQATGQRSAVYDETATTPAVGLVVRPWHWLSLYGNYIEGLTAGPTAPNTAINAGEIFAPFVSRQFELGAKVDLGRFGASAALFQITQPSSFTDPVTRRFSVDGEQRNRGLELTAFGVPAENLRILGGLTLMEGTLTTTAGGAFDGNRAPGVPKVLINLGGEVDVPFVPRLTGSARVVHTSGQFFDQANTQSIPAWTRLDLGARYRFEIDRKPFTARLNVENVTGVDYWASAGRGFLSLGAPRTYLFSLSTDL